jgi:diamine N-acetyltransferase
MPHSVSGRPKILLSALRASDLPLLWEWINHREQVLFNSSYRPISESQHRSWFDDISKRSDLVMFGIRLANSGKLIGTCQLHSISSVHRCAELQIRIGDVAQRGKGHGTAAVNDLLAFGFRDLNLNRVFLYVFVDNVAAIKTYAKCGFKKEGVLRKAAYIDGRYVDVSIMAILRAESSHGT